MGGGKYVTVYEYTWNIQLNSARSIFNRLCHYS